MAEGLASDPEGVLGLLAEMAQALDPVLARRAAAVAGRVALRLGAAALGGAGRLRVRPGPFDAGADLDLEASLVGLLPRGPSTLGLVGRRYRPAGPALAVLVDASGSMGGARLCTAAVCAAAVVLRAPERSAVLAFAGDVAVLRQPAQPRPAAQVVGELLALQGHGSTDLAAGLRAARDALADLGSARTTVLLLSDCEHNGPGDPVAAASFAEQVAVLAPAEAPEAAQAFARAVGGRVALVRGPLEAAAALGALLA
ncbi:VWA domain-containing protein [Aciditerrimonas ferrireducens]|uniref:VWA domain-containing protein n=1 Tax=Aciditerrimonas ferrireducens TaxID=667306 RepID=UPI0020068D99|nr:VWA domain-containing protein [Aciditerrimonas ferrireducens]MCK4176861.1 VWA domain-containing protein [Aciditerrimonas ferrireducens]